MNDRSGELDAFKRINLTEYAASQGYALDRKASCRSSAVMVHPDGDKIIIARAPDGHYVYFSVRDAGDNGTIIDFIQHRRRLNLGQVRRELRPWIGAAPASAVPGTPRGLRRPAAESYAGDLVPVSRDLLAVRARFEAMAPLGPPNGPGHAWLTSKRGLPPALLANDRFAPRICIDHRGNVIFPHFNAGGELTGYEIKNDGFTGFASGGSKSLWNSVEHAGDFRLVVAETAIDALSYAALRGHDGTRFVSIAGQMNPEQPAMIAALMQALPDGGEVIIATDADDAGDHLAGELQNIFDSCGRPDLTIRHDRPASIGADWNDMLRTGQSCPLPPGGTPAPE